MKNDGRERCLSNCQTVATHSLLSPLNLNDDSFANFSIDQNVEFVGLCRGQRCNNLLMQTCARQMAWIMTSAIFYCPRHNTCFFATKIIEKLQEKPTQNLIN